jgi:lysophospholipase L1-like esterase
MKPHQILLFAATSLFISLGHSVSALSIQPDDSHIRYTGRFTEDYRFSWTGSQIAIKFTGSAISAEMKVVKNKPVGMTAVIDGKPQLLVVKPGQTIYPLAEGLDPTKKHHVILFRRSEAHFGVVQFGGFNLPDGGTVERPADVSRKMLVIGDSITCGYGNEAKTVDEGNTLENENGYMSYAPITARHFQADLTMLCWSGRGLYRNRSKSNDTSGTLPKLFDSILPDQDPAIWDHTQYVPDVVVINLGTNDSATLNGAKPELTKEQYVSAYIDFITRIRAVAPQSEIFVTIGPMNHLPAIEEWLQAVADHFENVYPLVFSRMKGEADRGGHWHPSVVKDQSMAAELIAAINAHTTWKK